MKGRAAFSVDYGPLTVEYVPRHLDNRRAAAYDFHCQGEGNQSVGCIAAWRGAIFPSPAPQSTSQASMKGTCRRFW